MRRMQTDYLDSVIVHYVCRSFPVSDTVEALERLKEQGKIRAYGLSNSQPSDLNEYQANGGHVDLVQEFFSILSPFHGREYFTACRPHGTTFQTYGVLEEGFLTSPAFMDRTFVKTGGQGGTKKGVRSMGADPRRARLQLFAALRSVGFGAV